VHWPDGYSARGFPLHRDATAANLLLSVLGILCFLWDLQVKERADERTRTADLLITSEKTPVRASPEEYDNPHR
jgi:hypothetical protein